MNAPNPQLQYDVILTVEVGSAARLLIESLAILEERQPGADGADALFATLAMGMEKLTKLTLGLNGLFRGGGWPAVSTMKGYRHNIEKLDTEARTLIATHVNDAVHPGYMREALDAVSGDSNIGEIIRTMSVYADDGRFHNLDYLSDRSVKDDSPSQLWSDLEGGIVAPRLRSGMPPDEAAPLFNETVARSLRTWISCYRRAWQHGVLGPEGRQRAANLSFAVGVEGN